MRCLNCGAEVEKENLGKCQKCGVNLSGMMRDLLPVGKLLNHNKYRIEYPLGRGGFGVTYRAVHCQLEKDVAIKEFYPRVQALRDESSSELVIASNYQGNFEKGLERFLKEAKILNKIEHENIIKIRDFFEENNTAYIVMNLIEGKTLSSLLKEAGGGRIKKEKVKEIVGQLIEALKTIHEAEIYHLDIKPDNILITNQGKLVLVDFGASKQGLGNESTRAFTMAYAPLELISSQAIGGYSDIYSVGVMIYQMLTGKLPPDVLGRIYQDNWRASDLEEPWQELVESALKLKPEERPGDIKGWWQKFEREYSVSKIIGGRYQIRKKIGEGTFGITYLAADTRKLNNLCAIKELKCIEAETDTFPLWKKLFEREAEQLLSLGNHEQIPSLEAYFEERGKFYLVQEYIEGVELSQELIRKKRYSELETKALLKSILEPLEFLHEQGIIHRDIKPSNLIRRQRDGKIVLIDFGAVKQLSFQIADEAGSRKRGTIIGTPGYMAPEQALGLAKLASDIYGVGVIGIQALTGLSPQELEQSSQRELLWTERAKVSPFLRDLLTKMVRHNPSERYQNAQQVNRVIETKARIEKETELIEQLKQNNPSDNSTQGKFSQDNLDNSINEIVKAGQNNSISRRTILKLAGMSSLGMGIFVFGHYQLKNYQRMPSLLFGLFEKLLELIVKLKF